MTLPSATPTWAWHDYPFGMLYRAQGIEAQSLRQRQEREIVDLKARIKDYAADEVCRLIWAKTVEGLLRDYFTWICVLALIVGLIAVAVALDK